MVASSICMKMEMAIKSGSQREGGVVVFIGKRSEDGRPLSGIPVVWQRARRFCLRFYETSDRPVFFFCGFGKCSKIAPVCETVIFL